MTVSPVVKAGIAYGMITPYKDGKKRTAVKRKEQQEVDKSSQVSGTGEKRKDSTPVEKSTPVQPEPSRQTGMFPWTDVPPNPPRPFVSAEGGTRNNRPIARPVGIAERLQKGQRTAEQEEEVLNVDQVIAEPIGEVANFHTCGIVKEKRRILHKILVDGGSVINLMPDAVARELGLRFCNADRRTHIGTATGATFGINFFVQFDLTIANVTANIKAYLIPNPAVVTFSLLLGWRWMQQVKASGDYCRGTYVIEGLDGKRHILVPCDERDRVGWNGISTFSSNLDAGNVVYEEEETVSEDSDDERSWLCRAADRALGRIIGESNEWENDVDDGSSYEGEEETLSDDKKTGIDDTYSEEHSIERSVGKAKEY